jgi:RNA polymerase sigma factor (TIGR02999 family)
MSEVTRILSAVVQGDPHAAEQLLPLVYEELRKLAAQRLAQEKPGQTPQATALVHETYLQPVGPRDADYWANRSHFFAAAATAMRRILIERACHKRRIIHGGGRQQQQLHPDIVAAPAPNDDLLALDARQKSFAHPTSIRLRWPAISAGSNQFHRPRCVWSLRAPAQLPDRLSRWAYAQVGVHRLRP